MMLACGERAWGLAARVSQRKKSGGQPSDKGKLLRGNEEFTVVKARKQAGNVVHEVGGEGLKEGDRVKVPELSRKDLFMWED